MGKGDIKTRRGKIAKGSFGVTRPRPTAKSAASTQKAEKPKKSTTKKTASKK